MSASLVLTITDSHITPLAAKNMVKIDSFFSKQGNIPEMKFHFLTCLEVFPGRMAAYFRAGPFVKSR